MLNATIFTNTMTSNQTTDLAKALEFQFETVVSESLAKSIKLLDGKIKNKNGAYTSKQVDVFKEDRKAAKKAYEFSQEKLEWTREAHERVVNHILSVESANGMKNDKNAIENVMRLIAVGDNSNLRKMAIKTAFADDFKLKELMDGMVCTNASLLNDNGIVVNPKEYGKKHKEAKKLLNKHIQDMFSVKVANDYFETKQIKLNNGDMQRLLLTYVSSVKPTFEKVEGSIFAIYKGDEVNTALSVRETKKGVKLVKSTFLNHIADLVVSKLATDKKLVVAPTEEPKAETKVESKPAKKATKPTPKKNVGKKAETKVDHTKDFESLIAPKTVQVLAEAGYNTYAKVKKAVESDVKIKGIGAKRLADIEDAIAAIEAK